MKEIKYCFIVSLIVLLTSCGQDFEKQKSVCAFEAYSSIIDYAIDNKVSSEGYASVGRVTTQTIPLSGSASFGFITKGLNNSGIRVSYSIPYSGSASEKGELSDWYCSTLIDTSNCYPYCVGARWQPYGSGGGKLLVYVRKDNKVRISINGDGDWYYSDDIELASVGEVVSILKKAYLETVDLKRKELGPNGALLPYSVYKAEKDGGEGYLVTNVDGTECDFWYLPYVPGSSHRYVEDRTHFCIEEKGKSFSLDPDSHRFDNPFTFQDIFDMGECKISNGGKSITLINIDSEKSQSVFEYVGDATSLISLISCPPSPHNLWIVGTWDKKPIYYYFADGHFEVDYKDGDTASGVYTIFQEFVKMFFLNSSSVRTAKYRVGEWIWDSNFRKVSWITPAFQRPNTKQQEMLDCPQGRWTGGNSEMLTITKLENSKKGMAFSLEHYDGEEINTYEMTVPEQDGPDGQFTCGIVDKWGYDHGIIAFSGTKSDELIWKEHGCIQETWEFYDVTFHRKMNNQFSSKELEAIARKQAEDFLVESYNQQNLRAGESIVSKNNWIIGKWVSEKEYNGFTGEPFSITITKDGLAIYGSDEQQIRFGEAPNGGAVFTMGETSYVIDWENHTITSEYGDVLKHVE